MPSKLGHERCEISDPTDIADVFLQIFANIGKITVLKKLNMI